MRTVKMNIFKFYELDESIQERVLNDNRELEVECGMWSEILTDHWVEDLDKIGFEDAEIQFSGFNSQGDGASFTANVNLEKIISSFIYCDDFGLGGRYLALGKMHEKELIYLELNVSRINAQCCHGQTCSTEIRFNSNIDHTFSSAEDVLEYLAHELAEDVETIRTDLCEQIYYELKNEFEYLTSDEVVKEAIQDYEFTKDGKIFTE